jgi:L-ascorbate metabolism protein UlaG (beta-lactamase superfamily)
MSRDQHPLYLRHDIQIEPLVDNWYAWAYLIPPHTAARNLTQRHLKIMDSYISAPQIHANAVKNPRLLGGPFIDYDGKRVEEIEALRDQLKRDRNDLIALSNALDELGHLLRANGKGFSLQPLYSRVPEILRGYVELVYDLDCNPTARVIEPLLYRSRFFERSAFSLAFSRTRCDDRPFVLSTPRLPSDDTVQVPLAFDSVVVDNLFRTKTAASTWHEFKDMLGFPNKHDTLFRTFLTDEKPKPYDSYQGKGIRWRYFGHACILIETAGLSFLFDPALSYSYESAISRYTYEDLPECLDYVFVTHNHQDHILFETLLQLRHRIGAIVVPKSSSGSMQDPSLKLLLQAVGFKNIVEMGELETLQLSACSVIGLPFLGEHADLDIRSKLAYLVRIGPHSLMFAADSCNIEPRLYDHVHQAVGDVDALFVGMECDGAPLTWLYGPLLTRRIEHAMDESRRLSGSNYSQAIDIVNRLNCKEVYVYAMGQEPWLNHIMSIKYTLASKPIVESNRLIEECRSRGIHAERLFGEKEILLGV